jgi:ribose transport system permease protein
VEEIVAGAVTQIVRRLRGPGPFAAIWAATALLFAISPLIAAGSVGTGAIKAMLPFAGILAIAAVGQTLVVQQRGLDLSVPGTMSLAAALITTVPGGSSGKLPVALAVVALAAVACGLVIGLLVTRLGVTPLVATLGVNALAIGTVVKVTGGSIASSVPSNLSRFAGRTMLGVPMLAVLAAALIVVVWWLMRRTVGGRRFQLVGANPAAAQVAGIAVARYQVAAYVAASLCYAAAGVLLAGLSTAPSLFAGNPYLLPSIAAVVLGGTSLAGGRGSVVATGVGALFLSQLDQVVLATGSAIGVQTVIQGAIVALGMGLREVPWHRVLHCGNGDAAPAAPPAPRAAPVTPKATPTAPAALPADGPDETTSLAPSPASVQSNRGS